jgi:hypothetical protein
MQNMQFFTAKAETTPLSDTLAQAYILCHNREAFRCEILKRGNFNTKKIIQNFQEN